MYFADVAEGSDLSVIPNLFLQSTLDLSQPETFFSVFPFINQSGVSHVLGCTKTLQEKWSHYLDLIEMQIAHQIAHKSEAFFQAVASHDVVRDELGKALEATQALRHRVKDVDKTHVQGSLKGNHDSTMLKLLKFYTTLLVVLRCRISRQNAAAVYKKLQLMATIHQTQPTIQLLLSTSDYVGALDLINTTQEVVQQELIGINCFRYLNSQLKEMENLIEKMLATEFERVTTAELNRPLKDETLVVEEDRLAAVLSGMLRQRRYSFIELFKGKSNTSLQPFSVRHFPSFFSDEALTAMKALVKQATVEALAANDIDVERGHNLLDQLKHLNFTLWTNLMQQCMDNLTALLHRVRAIHDIMSNVVTMGTVRQEEVSFICSAQLYQNVHLFPMLYRISSLRKNALSCNNLLKKCCSQYVILPMTNVDDFFLPVPKTPLY